MANDEQRAAEVAKYVHVYGALENYRMGGQRKADALDDLRAAKSIGCKSYLDIGCGRGEMLDTARELGFDRVKGFETVPELVEAHADVVGPVLAHEVIEHPARGWDLVTCFDVVEHLVPGDEVALLEGMAHVADRMIVVTANNHKSVDPTTGAILHINIKPYDEWDAVIRAALGPDWVVSWRREKRYVSETWQALRR